MKRLITKFVFIGTGLMVYAAGVFAQDRQAVFNHVALSVYDLKESALFYEEILLLDTIPEPFRVGRHKWFEIAPGFSLHLVQDAKERKTHNFNSHICFSVKSISSVTDRLKKAGITYYSAGQEPGKVSTRVDGVKQLYFKDPDGYWIEINDDWRDALGATAN